MTRTRQSRADAIAEAVAEERAAQANHADDRAERFAAIAKAGGINGLSPSEAKMLQLHFAVLAQDLRAGMHANERPIEAVA